MHCALIIGKFSQNAKHESDLLCEIIIYIKIFIINIFAYLNPLCIIPLIPPKSAQKMQ